MPTPAPGPAPTQVIQLPPPILIGKDRVFVNPPFINLGSAPSVQWLNNTGGKARLWFPHGRKIFKTTSPSLPGPVDFSSPIDVPPGPTGLELIVDTPQVGHYRYSVYCEIINDFAQGNSEPEVDVP